MQAAVLSIVIRVQSTVPPSAPLCLLRICLSAEPCGRKNVVVSWRGGDSLLQGTVNLNRDAVSDAVSDAVTNCK